MSATVISERPQQSASDMWTGGITDGKRVKTARRVFQVETTDPDDGKTVVTNAVGIPKIFFPYSFRNEYDPELLCVGHNPRQISKFLWEVEVEYSSEVAEGGDEEDPLLQPPEYEVSFVNYRRPMPGSLEEQPGDTFDQWYGEEDAGAGAGGVWKAGPVNSAGEVYDPTFEVDDSRPVLRFTRNEATFNPSLAITFQDAINIDPFLGVDPFKAKMQGISATLQHERGRSYWRITYNIEFNWTKWTVQVVDAGTFYYDGGYPGGTKKAFLDNEGHPGTGLLDGAGDALADGATPVYREFWPYRTQLFGLLNIPNVFGG